MSRSPISLGDQRRPERGDKPGHRSIGSRTNVRTRRSQRGSALVEGAICFTALLALLFGCIDFGYAVYAYNFCSFAARDATRWTSVHGTNSATSSNCALNPGITSGCAANSADVQSYVTGLAIGLDSTRLTVTTTWTPNTSPGAEVNVNVAYSVAPLSGFGLKNGLNVQGVSQMEMVH